MTQPNWKLTSLANCCEVFSGHPFESSGFTNDPDDIPLVKGENVGQGEILWDISKRWPRPGADELGRYKLVSGDVVLAMDRPWVPAGLKFAKITASAPDSLLVQRVARLRARGGLVQEFLPYLIGSPSFVAYVKNVGRGVGVPHISGKEISAFEFLLPPKPAQRQIGQVLSAYDDLIENNRRRMVLLEESARLLYCEWFVHLRFPGHEHTRIIDGVPEGWEMVATPDAIEINPKIKLSEDDEHWFVEMADLPTDSMVIQGATMRDGRSGPKFQNGDTLLARITPCLENGKTGFVNFLALGESGRGSTEFIVLRSKRVTPEFVYCLARTYEFRGNAIKSMVGSSGRQRVQESCFEKFMVYVPPPSLLRLFSDFAEPAFEQIKNLNAQNQKLRAARDLLLPRLMSGEIAV